MTQDVNNPKHYIAAEGKVFQRIFDGFNEIKNPQTLGSELILGNIIIDSNGELLPSPIEDKIQYYTEVDALKRKLRNMEEQNNESTED